MLRTSTSVGFAPLKYAFTDDPQRRYGIDFLEQELLEFSIVTIPANPDALLDPGQLDEGRPGAPHARSGHNPHQDRRPMKPAPHPDLVAWAERTLASAGFAVVSRETLAAVERIEARLAIGVAAPNADFKAVLYAVYAGPYGDYHQARVFA